MYLLANENGIIGQVGEEESWRIIYFPDVVPWVLQKLESPLPRHARPQTVGPTQHVCPSRTTYGSLQLPDTQKKFRFFHFGARQSVTVSQGSPGPTTTVPGPDKTAAAVSEPTRDRDEDDEDVTPFGILIAALWRPA